MDLYNYVFHNVDPYNNYPNDMAPGGSQPSPHLNEGQAGHSGNARLVDNKKPAAGNKAPVPRHSNRNHHAHEQALVPVGKVIDRKYTNPHPPIPIKARINAVAEDRGGLFCMPSQTKQARTSTSLLKGNTQSRPVWSPAQEAALDDWKNSGIGPENRVKAVEVLTQFKRKGKTTLDLSNLALGSLPPVIVQMDIRELNLSHNSLVTLPPLIGSLTKLTKLNVSDNGLTSIPEEIGGLIRLKHLDLSGNNLADTLPATFARLQSLETLNLDGNGFIDVPVEVAKLNKLNTFSISDNKLMQAPDMMNRMQGLRHLKMANNGIKKVSGVWDLLLDRLKTLDLSGNIISELPFKNVPKGLKTLNVSNNPICDLPKTFGAIMWAENGALKTTSRNTSNMRIIVENTHLIAGLHKDGRLELRDENDLYELPVVLRSPPRGGSISDSDFSDINPAEWGAHPLPPGGVEGMSVVNAPEYDRFGDKVSSSYHSEKMRKDIQDKISRIERWRRNDLNP